MPLSRCEIPSAGHGRAHAAGLDSFLLEGGTQASGNTDLGNLGREVTELLSLQNLKSTAEAEVGYAL